MATLESIQDWLWQPDAQPIVLIDLVHSAGTRRISTYPYITYPTDNPANVIYDDVTKGGITLASAIGENQTVGSVEFYALEGEQYFNWLSYQMWLGDLNWHFSQFAPLAAGAIKRMNRPDPARVRLEFADPSDALKTPVLTEKTGESYTPLVLGSVLNISPIVQDAAIAKYRASLINTSITQVRDNGVSVGFTNNNDGTFTLSSNPVGQVTLDANAGSYDTVTTACTYLAGLKGIALQSTVNFTSTQASAKIGLYITDASLTIWDAINQLCASIGAFPRFNALGQFEIVHIPHAGAADFTLENDDILRKSAVQQNVLDKADVQLNYRKNWTPQTQLAASVTVANRDFYAREYTSIAVNNGAKDKQVFDTLLTDANQAAAEAARRGALWAQKRETWQVTAVLPGMTSQLGTRTALQIAGVVTGKSGTVVSWIKNLNRKTTEMEILL